MINEMSQHGLLWRSAAGLVLICMPAAYLLICLMCSLAVHQWVWLP